MIGLDNVALHLDVAGLRNLPGGKFIQISFLSGNNEKGATYLTFYVQFLKINGLV